MTEPIALKVGDTIRIGAHEYVLFYLTETEDMEGRGGRLEFMDPLRAMRHMNEQQQRRATLELQAQMAPMMPKMDQALNEALS